MEKQTKAIVQIWARLQEQAGKRSLAYQSIKTRVAECLSTVSQNQEANKRTCRVEKALLDGKVMIQF